MAVNVKIGLIGAFDMLKFKNMAKKREKVIQAAPAKDIVCDYKINANAKLLHPDRQVLVVKEIIDHPAAGAKTIVFGSADGSPVAFFRAGQYLSLKLPINGSFVTRPYSISSSPKWALEGKYAVTVRRNPTGFAADWILENLKPGDEVLASAPEGQFFYENLRDCKNVVALAGGSGITPFLSMAYAIRDGLEDFNLTIILGSNTEDVILFREELDEICKATDKVKVVHVLANEEKEGFEHGFINADVIRKYAAEPYSIFICGPEGMYRFVAGEVAKLDKPRREVRREMLGVTKKVWEQPGYPQESKGQTYQLTVRQGALEQTIPALADEPLLVAIERAGIKAPSKCRSGECGWCRSRLISGTVFVPQDNEYRRFSDVELGYVHPCCTFATGDCVLEVPGEYLG